MSSANQSPHDGMTLSLPGMNVGEGTLRGNSPTARPGLRAPAGRIRYSGRTCNNDVLQEFGDRILQKSCLRCAGF